jgi:hypothetical protein
VEPRDVSDTTDEDVILEVGAFYQLLTAQLESAFGRRHPHWVRGEIAKVYEKGHVYVDLVDAGSASSDTKRPVLQRALLGDAVGAPEEVDSPPRA